MQKGCISVFGPTLCRIKLIFANFWQTDLFWHEKHRFCNFFGPFTLLSPEITYAKEPQFWEWHLCELIFRRRISTRRECKWLLLAASTARFCCSRCFGFEISRKTDQKRKKLTDLVSNWCHDKTNSHPSCLVS